MTWLWWAVSALGLGGSIALGAFFAPVLMVRVATGIVEAALTAVSWLGSAFMQGIQYILGQWYAVLALVVCILASGYIGDRFDPVRSHLPNWLRSKPAISASAPVKHAAEAKPQTDKKPTPKQQAKPSESWLPSYLSFRGAP